MERSIEDLAEDVRGLRERHQLDQDVLDDVRAKLDSISEDYEQIDRSNAFRHFLHGFLRRQRRRFKAGDRDEPLCECADPECSLKNGKLPGDVRLADDLLTGIYQHQERHPDAIVLMEARDEWASKRARVRVTLRECRDRLDSPEAYADA